MTHLLVHLVKENDIIRPIFLHNIFSFERFMAVLKKYVRNHACPEESISSGYGTEEVIEFCVDYLSDLNPIGLPVSHHEGRLKGKGTLEKKCNVNIPCSEFSQANFMVLQNSSKVAPYIDEHMNIIWFENPQKNLIVVPLFRCE